MKVALSTLLIAGAALPLASHAAEYANVVSATPVTEAVAVPRQVCSDTVERVRPQPSGAGAVIGAIAGGVLGHTIGGGFGRAAATGIGAVAGAAVGNSVELNGYPPSAVPVRRCQTVASYENRTVAWDVVYEYAGRRYATRVAERPGAHIAVDVRAAGAEFEPDEPELIAAPPRYESPPAYYAPQPPAYYAPAPRVYYAPAPVVAPPAIYISPAVGYGHWHRGHRWY